MIGLKNYLAKWNLTHPTLIAQTPTSSIYKALHNKNQLILKIFTEVGRKFENDSSIALKHFNQNGTVTLIDYDESAQLLEFIDGISLKEHFFKTSDESTLEILCQVLDRIHRTNTVHQAPFKNMEIQISALKRRALQEKGVYEEAYQTARKLIKNQKETLLLHGDIHHENILFSSHRGWVAIDPQPLIGERAYDFANSFFNPITNPSEAISKETLSKRAHLISLHLNEPKEKILEYAFVHGALSSTWQKEDGENNSRRLIITRSIQSLLPRT